MEYTYTGPGANPEDGFQGGTSRFVVFDYYGNEITTVTLYHKTSAHYVELEPFERDIKAKKLLAHRAESLEQVQLKDKPFKEKLEFLCWNFNRKGKITGWGVK